jgi:HTH-type transcriptional regulator, competence development regulator
MFAERLAHLRNEKRLTHQEMADKLGITRQAYGYYENGKREPDLKTIQKLADIFHTNVDYLLGRTEDSFPIGTPTEYSQEWIELHNKIKQKGAELQATAILRTASQMTVRQLEDILRVFEMIEKDKGKSND